MRKFKIKIELANKVARPKKSTLSPFFLDLSMRRMPHTPKIKLIKPIRILDRNDQWITMTTNMIYLNG